MSLCVIIGHGRSPEGKGWGERIDAADAVVRMWDWTWQDAADYGRRYDYGIIEIGGNLISKAMHYKRADPAIGWIASQLQRVPCKLPPNTEVVDQTPWNKLGKRLGGVGATGRLQFTRGTIAGCWAITSGKWKEVVLVGFDVIGRGQTGSVNEDFCQTYQANPGTFSFHGWHAGMTKFGNHDFQVERKVMEKLAADHDVGLWFAQGVW